MESTIAELYRVFQPYRIGDDFSGCDHCVSAEDSERLVAIPLRELAVSDVDRYAFKAMTTWGTVRHFKYFLPRLFELAFDDFPAFAFPEVLFGKLAHAEWVTWPVAERDAVRNFLDGFWQHQLHSPGDFPTDERIRTALGALAEACDSIKPYLAIWRDQRANVPALHLAQLIDDSADQMMTAGTIDLWEKSTTRCDELAAWLASDDPLPLLDAFRDTVTQTFPFVLNQLDGIHAAMSAG